MFGIDPSLYYPLHQYIVLAFSVMGYFKLSSLRGSAVLKQDDGMEWMKLFLIILVFFVGLRPITPNFGDTINYATIYRNIQTFEANNYAEESDWLFSLLMRTFALSGIGVEWFFLVIMAGYVVPMYVACRRLLPERANLLTLFCLGAYSFYTYATNGIRNGMACSLVILALTYIDKGRRENVIFAALAFIAVGIHKSTVLPVAAILFALFYKKPKTMFYFWLASIVVSLVAGGAVTAFFEGLGFDDRIQGYIGRQGILEEGAVFSNAGFRWDFLLYSSMPILLGWYVIMKRGIVNRSYYILLATYIYSNAFWVMVIRAPFSNRFAYLSWFLYPIVLAYPLLHLPVFKIHHSKKTAMILLAHFGFTFVMWLMGK